MRRRHGFTLVEALVGVAVALLVIGGAWGIFVGASKGGKRILEYSSALEASTSIRARLTLDLAGAFVPQGMNQNSRAFRVEDEGRKVSFLTALRVADPRAVDLSQAPRHRVTWQAVDDGGGGYVIERLSSGGESQRWGRVRCLAAHFRVLHHEAAFYFVGDLLLQGSRSAAIVNPKDFPVRVTRRLLPEGHVLGGLMPFPQAMFPDLPAESEGEPVSLLTAAQRRIQLTRGEDR